MKIFISAFALSVSLISAQTIEMTQQQQSDLGVKIQKVSSVKFITFGPYNGVVSLDKKDIISVSSNVESVIKEIYVRNYQKVRMGEKLVTIRSNELLNLQQEYIQAVIDNKNINENYLRNIKLQTDGIISSKKLAISKKEKDSSSLAIKLNASYLLASGLSKSMLRRIQTTHMPIMQINILAPRSGVISDINVNIGQVVDSDTSMVNMYADGKRFIEITIPVKMVEKIAVGDTCMFGNFTGKITTIGNIVNENSQSIQARAVIQDAKNIMINRIYGVHISKHITHAVKIAKSALVYEDSKAYVFKQVASGFEVIKVEIISEGPTCYVVDADLSDSDKIAVSSTSALLGGMESGDE